MSDFEPTPSVDTSSAPESSQPPTSEPPSSSQSSSSTTEPPSSSSVSTTQPPSSEPSSSSTTSEQPSSSDQPSSSPDPSSSSTTTSPPPTSSSTTSSPPPPSSTSSSSTSTSLSPTVVPSSTTLVLPSSSAPSLVTTPTGLFTTTDASGSVITGSLTLSLTTDANGRTLTVTQVIKGTPSLDAGSGSRHGSSDFFDNTGAVAGVFVVVGLVVTAFLATFTWFMLRRRRRQRLDRDVSAAAAAAAAAQHPRFEDDDEPGMTQYNGFYTTHNGEIEGQQPQNPHHNRGYDYEDPAGGYDPYAANLVDVPLAGGADRMSTATAPGFAGYGAGQAYYQNEQNVDFSQQPGDFQHSYGDPQYDVAHNYAGPDEPLAGQAGHDGQHQTSYNYYNYADEVPHDNVAYPAPAAQAMPRPESVGSIASGTNHRDLTVTNV